MVPGFLLIRKNIIGLSALKDFSQVIVKVFYPCLIFSSMTKNYTLGEVLESWQLPVSVFLILLTGYLTGLAYLGFFKKINGDRRKAMLFQFTINNYSFLPLAIIAKLYNEQYMAALILSTLGAEITVWTLGMFILNKQSGGINLKNLKHLMAPPLISIYFSLFVLVLSSFFEVSLPQFFKSNVFFDYLNKSIYELGHATIPLSMIMIGGRMGKIRFNDLKDKEIWISVVFRLFVVPLIAILMVKSLFAGHPYINVMLIVAIMPNAIASLVLGEIYGADQKMLSGTVLVSHLLALITIPLWLLFLL